MKIFKIVVYLQVMVLIGICYLFLSAYIGTIQEPNYIDELNEMAESKKQLEIIEDLTEEIPLVPDSLSVEEQITAVAEELGFKDIVILLQIAYCESGGFDEEVINGKKLGTQNERGLFQFHPKWHAEVSDKCSFNIVCATKEAIRVYLDRGKNEWSCGKKIN